MGIDVYARWEGMTEDEEEAQYGGFSVTSGDTGYLREAYHGTPYATMVLVPECFEPGEYKCKVKASELRKRLPEAAFTCLIREAEVYGSALARELLCIMGHEPRLDTAKTSFDIDETDTALQEVFATVLNQVKESRESPRHVNLPDGVTEATFRVIASRVPVVKAYFDFVELAERKEAETGTPVTVEVSA
jgi:hypothetical protein